MQQLLLKEEVEALQAAEGRRKRLRAEIAAGSLKATDLADHIQDLNQRQVFGALDHFNGHNLMRGGKIKDKILTT